MTSQSTANPVENRPLATVYRVDDLVVDTGRVKITRDGRELPLPKLSFDLLIALIEAAPRVVSPDELMDRVWSGLVVSPETVSQRVKLLRDSLDDDPRTPRYVAGVRGRGYRLLPAVVREDLAQEAVDTHTGIAAPTPRSRWRFAAAILALVVIAVAAAWFLLGRDRDAAPADAIVAGAPLPARSVAVLAFENRGGAAGNDILAQGIPETVLHQLARFPGLTVIARGSSFAFRDRPDDLRVIGRKLNVRYLLEGSVQTAGQRLRVTSSLIDAQSGASVWSMQFDRAAQDVFAVQDEIAVEVARAMQLTLDAGTAAAASLQQGATRSYEAYLAFLRGRALLANVRVAELPAAIDSLAAAIRHDPEFAAAHVLLARARVELAEHDSSGAARRDFPQTVESAMQSLDRAIALDPKNGEAYVERGYLKAYFDLAAADADLQRGIELAPSYARGYEGLAAVQFQSVARRREALEMIEKARRLDPLEPRLDVIKATFLRYGSGDSEKSTAILQSVLDRDPLYVPALVRLAEFRWNFQGQHAESILLGEQAVALDPGNEQAWRQLVFAYLDVGDDQAAASALRGIEEQPRLGWLALHLHRRDWRRAGEAAYALIAAGPTSAMDERRVALAIRMHARATGDYDRAIKALEPWALVEWDGDEPLLGGQLDQGSGVAGLADMLMMAGQQDRARRLARELLADTDVQIKRYGRGEIWLNEARAVALVLLDRPDDAIATMKRMRDLGASKHSWRTLLEYEPLFASLRERPEFQAMVADASSNAAREREQLARMRADGLVPKRS
ncbi:MAG: winged helix-turn-helix domain-containing protein [Steroidobacteraceae bacterium]